MKLIDSRIVLAGILAAAGLTVRGSVLQIQPELALTTLETLTGQHRFSDLIKISQNRPLTIDELAEFNTLTDHATRKLVTSVNPMY